jgi:hypothetical protein
MSTLYSFLRSETKPLNFGVLLVVLCLLIVVAPLATAAGSVLLVESLFGLVLLAGAYSVSWRGVQLWSFLAFTALTFVVRWCAVLVGGIQLELASAVITCFWIALVIIVVLGELFRRHDVTTNTIMGAIVAYLLIAVAFASLYEIIERSEPGSFLGIPEGATYQTKRKSQTETFQLPALTNSAANGAGFTAASHQRSAAIFSFARSPIGAWSLSTVGWARRPAASSRHWRRCSGPRAGSVQIQPLSACVTRCSAFV